MRLQVEVRRHLLPPVNIVYNTTSSNNPIKTISELLSALDKIIPLESVDGEWGLEDYIVEVAATSDQKTLYECLHYQLVKDVFREDDEVIIRGLTSDEIRERRQGGRLQILPDGRHLFDGVAWGRRFNSYSHRPGVIIPPRKRRRLLPPEEDDTETEDQLVQIGYPEHDARMDAFVGDDEYEEDDDDEDYDSGDEEESDDEEVEDHSRQIVARQDFDDADADSHDDRESSVSDNEHANGIDDNEVQLLLKEAGELEEAYHALPLEARITNPSKKRRRTELGQSLEEERDVTFEGFSTPVKQTKIDSNSEELEVPQSQDMIGNHVVTEPDHASTRDSRTSGKTNGVSIEDQNKQPASKRKQHTTNGANSISKLDDGNSSDYTSSSEESESESDSSSESSSNVSDDDSESSSNISTSDSEDTSSSDESDGQSGSEPEITAITKHRAVDTTASLQKTDSEPTTTLQVNNPPGTGTKRTRSNNNRVKRRKRLANLKAEGLLPPDADLKALREYDDMQNATQDTAIELNDEDMDTTQLAQRKEELLAKLNAGYGEQYEAPENNDQIQDAEDLPQPRLDEGDQVRVEPPQPRTTEQAKPETPQKRRLDVESSRRMLFSSLGLKNPKTPAAEQALREKLSQPTRQVQTRQQEVEEPEAPNIPDDDSWKNKLIISAIECVQEGIVLSPPPFPFKQRWERVNQKKKAHLSEQYYQQEEEAEPDVAIIENAEATFQAGVPTSTTDSRTISAGNIGVDDIAYPTDLEKYPSLQLSDVQVGAIIAYKQLELNSKFEPEASPYRVAQIVKIEEDLIDLVLASRDRIQPSPVDVNEETGERVFNKFEMPMDEPRLEDDGLRESTFEDLIGPKLILTSYIQVANSTEDGEEIAESAQANQDSAVIPESVPTSTGAHVNVEDVEVDTPRRNEITNMIKNAGFSSGLDEQLLQPIDMPKTHRASGMSGTNFSASTKSHHTESTKLVAGSTSLWRSTPITGNEAHNTSQVKMSSDPHVANSSSPPSVSMVETVDYPHVSQIDINQPSLADHAASSSHQDAQRVPPDVYDMEHSNVSDLHMKNQSRLLGDSQASSLASEVPQSQTNGASLRDYVDEIVDDVIDKSVSLRGGITQTSDLESDALDSDHLPSLRSLTSSQKQRTSRGMKFRPSPSRLSKKVSPPPLRKGRSLLTTMDGSDDPLESSEPEIKVSASQLPTMNMSQIPQNTQVVDLTFSSDPVEASQDEDADQEYDSARARRRAARSTRIETSQDDSQDSGRAMKGAFARFGSKRSWSGKGKSQV